MSTTNKKYDPQISELLELRDLANKVDNLKRKLKTIEYNHSCEYRNENNNETNNNCEQEVLLNHETQIVKLRVDLSDLTNLNNPKVVEIEKPVYVEKVIEVEKPIEKVIEKIVYINQDNKPNEQEIVKEIKEAKASVKTGQHVKYRRLKNNGMSEAGWKIFELVKQTQQDKIAAEKRFDEQQEEKKRQREQKRLEKQQKLEAKNEQ
ncbi:hypothetical protein [Ureaplasma parvum]|uniref:hypothetical protein n=1 Tax=Ureaplasma parvum TaxID=134821 RepID=UPI0026E9BEC2|nr:hypothetical protein [Ureaplasma parvum]